MKKFFLQVLLSDNRYRLYAWLSLVSQILIVVTGGAVRLTASGLGCPTWPKCTDDSWVNTPEMAIHGLIEFANRLLTFVLLVIALLTFGVLVRIRRQHRTGFLLSLGLGLGIVLQAVIGGITVLTQLNAWVVGLHFVVSAALIVMATCLVYLRIPRLVQPRPSASVNSELWTSRAISLVGAVTILVGVVVTGAGPHAGDYDTPRNGFDLEVWQHYHSWPGYILLALLLLALFRRGEGPAAIKANLRSRSLWLTLIVAVLQAIVGVAQARLGVPALLVGIHMLGAATLCALITWQHLTALTQAKSQNK